MKKKKKTTRKKAASKKKATSKKRDPEALRAAIELLNHARSNKRESGAKRLRKLADPSAGPALLEALEKEVQDRRTYGTQYHMILALGFCGARKALPFLWELAGREQWATLLYQALGDAIVRLEAKGTEAVLQVIASENFMLIYGALRALALLGLVPTAKEIRRIIKVAEDPRAVQEVSGYPGDKAGVRQWVAVAAADWPKTKRVREFLEDCLEIDDDSLQRAAKAALEGKLLKWRPY